MAEGYDTNRFHSPIEDGFVCSICLGVLQDPKQCENNEHYFCSGCIKKHLKKTQNCPACQDKLTVETLRKAPRIVSECISRYKISCDHAERGCDAVVELGALQAHVQECDFMLVTCSNEGCGEVVSKRDVKKHELDLCPFKTTTCDNCRDKMPRHKYGGHGCVLRRDVDEMKKKLAKVKSTQHEMMTSIKRLTIAVENLEKWAKSKSIDIIVIAGMNPETEQTISSVDRFNLFSKTWKKLPGLKIARQLSATVLFRNQVFVCGGINESDDFLDSIEVLDLNGSSPEWHEFFVNLPIKVHGHKCVVHGNRLLIIGGSNDSDEILDTIYELLLVPPYSPKLLCHMKKKRCYHGVELFEDDKVLIAGGHGAETDVEIFDIEKNECVEMPSLPSSVLGMGTVRRGDTMLLIGGAEKFDADKVSNEIIEYDIKTGQSKALLTMKTRRAFCSCVSHGNTLIVIGGAQEDYAAVDCFNFSSKSWKKLPSMAEPSACASVVVVNTDF